MRQADARSSPYENPARTRKRGDPRGRLWHLDSRSCRGQAGDQGARLRWKQGSGDLGLRGAPASTKAVVGDAMREAFEAGTVRREDLFVTTKLWNNTIIARAGSSPLGEASLRLALRLDHADCYLVHTPFAFKPGDELDPRDEHGQPIYDSGVIAGYRDLSAGDGVALVKIEAAGAQVHRTVRHRPGEVARDRCGCADQAGRRRGRMPSLSSRMGAARFLQTRHESVLLGISRPQTVAAWPSTEQTTR